MPSTAALVRLHEGLRLTVYDDATGEPIGPGATLIGHPTIGVGRALDVRGISAAEADALLVRDLDEAARELTEALPWVARLDPVRRAVLIDMRHNLGQRGLLRFRRTLAAVEAGDWAAAARGMGRSRWARQVKTRAVRLQAMMQSGAWPPDVTHAAPLP